MSTIETEFWVPIFLHRGFDTEIIDGIFRQTTFSRDVSAVAHEFTHGIQNIYYNTNLLNSGQSCALSESLADIMGLGIRRFVNSGFNINDGLFYNPSVGIDAIDNGDLSSGIRNAANPNIGILSGFFSYIGEGGLNLATLPSCITGSDSDPGGGGGTGTCTPSPTIQCVSGIIGPKYTASTVILHLYHLMTHGGFNIDSNFRPTIFDIHTDSISSLNETFTYKRAEQLFLDAMILRSNYQVNQNINGAWTGLSFCELRNKMMFVASPAERPKLDIAWRQVFEDIDNKCSLPGGLTINKPNVLVVSQLNNVIENNSTINFSNVALNTVLIKRFTIINNGNYKLKIKNASISGNTNFSITNLDLNQQIIRPNHALTFNIVFSASNSATISNATLTFITSDNNNEQFVLNLVGESVNQSGQPDAYEDDETPSSSSHLGINDSVQSHNFVDDTEDWIRLVGYSNNECSQYNTCYIQFNNVSNSNICIERFTRVLADPRGNPQTFVDSIISTSPKKCNLSINNIIQTSKPIIWPVGGSGGSTCRDFYPGLSNYYRITGSTYNESYDLQLICN